MQQMIFMINDIFVNCNWVVTRWQYPLHTNNTQNNTKQQYIQQHNNFGRVRAVPRLGQYYPGICLTTEEKARKNLSQGSRVKEYVDNNKYTQTTIRVHGRTIRIHMCLYWQRGYFYHKLAQKSRPRNRIANQQPHPDVVNAQTIDIR